MYKILCYYGYMNNLKQKFISTKIILIIIIVLVAGIGSLYFLGTKNTPLTEEVKIGEETPENPETAVRKTSTNAEKIIIEYQKEAELEFLPIKKSPSKELFMDINGKIIEDKKLDMFCIESPECDNGGCNPKKNGWPFFYGKGFIPRSILEHTGASKTTWVKDDIYCSSILANCSLNGDNPNYFLKICCGEKDFFSNSQ